MKIKIFLALLFTAIIFSSCKKDDEGDYNFFGDSIEPGKTLIVYFTRTNNTQQIANHIEALTGADLYRIEVVNPYPSDYNEATRVAEREKDENARPQIANLPENIDEYQTIMIGFPIWWSSRPMVIATFLESFDFGGKNIVPFCTHGGGGVGQAFAEISAHTPGSKHLEGFVISGSQASEARSQVQSWLNRIFIQN